MGLLRESITPGVTTDINADLTQAYKKLNGISVDVKADFGAVGNGTTDDTTRIQAAIDALATTGGTVFLPRGQFTTTAPLTIPTHGIRFQGAGCEPSAQTKGSWIVNSVSDLVSVPSGAYKVHINWDHIGLCSQPGGGHIFNIADSWADWQFNHVMLTQQNAAKSAINATGAPIGGYIGGWSVVSGVAARSVPLVQLVAAGSITGWGIEKSIINCTATDTAPAIYVENTAGVAGASASQNFFRTLVVEVSNGGFLKMLGLEYTEVADIWMGDMPGSTTDDLIYVGAGSGGKVSSNNVFRRIKAYGRTLGASKYDFNLVNGLNTLDACFGLVNFNNQNGNTVENSNTIGGELQFVNPGTTTVRPQPVGRDTHVDFYDANGDKVSQISGRGSPEGVVTAGIGSTYQRSDGGASTCFYVKESGTGNTGWRAV